MSPSGYCPSGIKILNMLKKTLSALLVILCIVSCRKEILPEFSEIPIDFRDAEVETKTAGIINNTSLTTMGLIASYSLTEDYDGSENGDTPNYMRGQKVRKTSTAWEYSPLKYWPSDPNSKISFFAYAPFAEEPIITVCPKDYRGYPYITYIVPEKPEDQLDLLAAPPVLNRLSSDGTIPFSLRHTLSKVKFESEGFYIDELSVGGVDGKADLVYTKDGFEWKNLAPGYSSYELVSDTHIDINTVFGTSVSNDDGTLMMIPQSLQGNNKMSLSLKYHKATGFVTEYKETTCDMNVNWEAGKSYKYMLTISTENKLLIKLYVGQFDADGENNKWILVGSEETINIGE